MQDLEISSNTNDLVFTGYDLNLVSEIDRIRQQLQIRLQFFKGEWFLNQNFGIPYFESIFIKKTDTPLIESILKSQIKAIAGVSEILSFELDFIPSTRKMDLDFVVNTIYGQLEFSEVI